MGIGFFTALAILGANEPATDAVARELNEEGCRKLSDVPQTRPLPADLNEVFKDLESLKSLNEKKVFENLSPKFKQSITDLFSRDSTKVSKLEQFYGLLFFIAQNKSLPGKRLDFDPASVRKLLLSSKTFSKPSVPNDIQAVTLFWNSTHDIANYVVKFKDGILKLPLNEGRGFPSFKEGLCQVAEELHFYGGFEFDVKMTGSNNIYVYNFKDVDLFGRFGSRGMVDVDINYISVKSVEFLKGSPFGIVRAKVSRKEFEINDHSALLRLVTNFVTDKSTQPIDW